MSNYKAILEEISDALEGGDVVLDFEDAPYCQGVLNAINAIVNQSLNNIRDSEELHALLKTIGDEKNE
jgi:hypothetical protein